MERRSPGTFNLVKELNALVQSIRDILDNRVKGRYFEGIALLHSCIEDLLKWLVFVQILENGMESDHLFWSIEGDNLFTVQSYCNQLSFYNLAHLGLIVGLLDRDTFLELNEIRSERNRLVHQYWLYNNKRKPNALRPKLTKLFRVLESLVEDVNRLSERTEINKHGDLWFTIQPGRNLMIF